MTVRMLVCGGRDWDDELATELVLNFLHSKFEIVCVVHGDATGADNLAKQWANRHDVKQTPFIANWRLHGVTAGFRRNRCMLKHGNPDLVFAFPGGNGTEDMVEISNRARIPVLRFGGWERSDFILAYGAVLVL